MLEQEIVQLYLARDERAIQLTQEQYGNYCKTIAYRILQNEEETSECLNDTWYRAWQTIPPAIPQHLGGYLAKITRNLALNRYRYARQKKREADRVTLCLHELEECIPAHETPEQCLEHQYIAELINTYLRNLPKTERMMFVRRYFYMESVSEVAASMKCSEAKVKTTMFRCRKKLKQYLISEEAFV